MTKEVFSICIVLVLIGVLELKVLLFSFVKPVSVHKSTDCEWVNPEFEDNLGTNIFEKLIFLLFHFCYVSKKIYQQKNII